MDRPLRKELTEEEQKLRTISAAKDSIFVINQTLEKLSSGEEPSSEHKGNLERNVEHLKLIVSKNILEDPADIEAFDAAIQSGEAKIAEDIWPAE